MTASPTSFSARFRVLVGEALVVLLIAIAVVIVLVRPSVGSSTVIVAWFGLLFGASAVAASLGLGVVIARTALPLTTVMRLGWLGLVGLSAALLSVLAMSVLATSVGDGSPQLAVKFQAVHSLIFCGAMLVTGAVWHAWLIQRERGLPFGRQAD